MSQWYWPSQTLRIWIVVAVVLVVGFGRLWIDKRPHGTIEPHTAKQLAECLGPAKAIAANTAVTLDQVPVAPAQGVTTGQPAPQRTGAKLDFRAKTVLNVDLGPGTVPVSRSLSLTKDKGGDFEFELSGGPSIVTAGDNPFYLKSGLKARFGPATKSSYHVRLADNVALATKIEAGRTVAVLPLGATGTVEISGPTDLVTLHTIATQPWLAGIKSTLLPVRAIGQQGLSDLSIDMRQGGVRFDEQGFVMDGCAWRTGGEPGTPVGVAEIKASGTGAAVARVTIPSDLIPAWPVAVRHLFYNIELVLASRDGQYKAYGGFTAVPKLLAAIIALAIVGGILWWLVTLRAGEFKESMETLAKDLAQQNRMQEATNALRSGSDAWFSSLFLGSDHQPSLSLFQVFFWTVIAVWGISYVYLTTGNLLAMSTSMMILLGIAGIGTIIARWVSPDPKATTNATNLDPPKRPFQFWQILSTNGNFDMLKLQLMAFTLVIGAWVVWRIADTAAFPELDANTLLLLGVSQGVYVGGKLGGSTGLNRVQALKIEIDSKTEARDNLRGVISADNAQLPNLQGAANSAALANVQARIAANTTKLNQLNSEITAAQAELDKLRKDLGLS